MDIRLSVGNSFLGESLNLRPARWSDAKAVAQLTYDACAAEKELRPGRDPDQA